MLSLTSIDPRSRCGMPATLPDLKLVPGNHHLARQPRERATALLLEQGDEYAIP